MLERTPARTCAAGRFQETARVRQLAATLVRNRSTHEVKHAGLNHDDPLRASCRIRLRSPAMSGGSDRASMGARRPGPGRPPAAIAHARFGAVEIANASASGLRGSRGSLEDEVRCEEGAQKQPPWVAGILGYRSSADGVCGCRTLILKRSASDIGEDVASASRHGASGEHYSARSPSPRNSCRTLPIDSVPFTQPGQNVLCRPVDPRCTRCAGWRLTPTTASERLCGRPRSEPAMCPRPRRRSCPSSHQSSMIHHPVARRAETT